MCTQMKLIECFDIPREVWDIPLCLFLSLPCHSLFLPILALFGNAKVADLIHVAKPSRLKNANSDIF